MPAPGPTLSSTRDEHEVSRSRAPAPRPAAAPAQRSTARLGLLEGFELRSNGAGVSLPMSAQRVLAFLALHTRPLQRVYVAGNLWSEVDDDRAGARLRTALWRAQRACCDLVDATSTHVTLAVGVAVDARDAAARARRVLRSPAERRPEDLSELCAAGELLPDWYDEWLMIEREQFRQLRLHALESLCDALAAAGRFAEATEAGLAAVAAEPLRESAHRALMRVHLAEGNPGEAMRQYGFYRELVTSQLGVQPSEMIDVLLRRARSA